MHSDREGRLARRRRPFVRGRRVLLALLALVACTFTFDRVLRPGELRGRAVLSLAGGGSTAAPGARVSVTGSRLLTRADRSGRFVLRGLPPGTYTVQARHDADGDGRDDAAVVLRNLALNAGPGGTEGRDLGAVPVGALGRVQGTVRRDGLAVGGARVVVGALEEALASDDGTFLVKDVPPGTHAATVAFENEAGATVAFAGEVRVAPLGTATLDVAVESLQAFDTGTLRGTVRGEAGRGLAGIRIELSGTGPARLVASTDAAGAWSADDVPAGVYTLVARAPEGDSASLPRVVVGGPRVDVPDLLLAPAAALQDCGGETGGADPDEDGVPDAEEPPPCRCDARGTRDQDGDGVCDGDDRDDDADGRADDRDLCPLIAHEGPADGDSDGAGDACDNCLSLPNGDQADGDRDGVGDACDNCPAAGNPGQQDTDRDGTGDACEAEAPDAGATDGGPGDGGPSGCLPGETDCGGGACADLTSDEDHCGQCGKACAYPFAITQCVAGRCELRWCATGHANPDGATENGCECEERDADTDGVTTCAGDCGDDDVSIAPFFPEICDGKDNNCDGGTDENDPGSGVSCPTGLYGSCAAGTRHCVSGAPACVPDRRPGDFPDTCNGADDDCDGLSDNGVEGLGLDCPTGLLGACATGRTVCEGGVWGCRGPQPGTAAELCNGKDDNCDGATDEGNPEGSAACTTGLQGLCSGGTYRCSGGVLSCVPDVQPGTQPEVCDGVDNDCVGGVDDLPQQSCGLGACRRIVPGCTAGAPSVCVPGTPSASEICEGLVDDDCNGSVDDGCGCVNGATTACFSYSAALRNVGRCHDGTRVCTAGQWDACVGEVGPGAEDCNGADDDCNGLTDDLAGAMPCATYADIFRNRGACRDGWRTCSSGTWSTCVDEVAPTNEVCFDGADNDCNGATDDGCPDCSAGQSRACWSVPEFQRNTGVCVDGTQTCAGGYWDACLGEVKPTSEACDGDDDDCDGVTDNGCACVDGRTESCWTGASAQRNVGECRDGSRTCGGGAWGACVGGTLPTGEACDGDDDDCDGVTDNGCGCADGQTEACWTVLASQRNRGVCHDGLKQCSGGAWGGCVGETLPATETCDGQDEDCDGVTDNGCGAGACTDGQTEACWSGTALQRNMGICRDGVRQCAGGAWGACTGEILPGVETCNNFDDDCNGMMDDGAASGGPCYEYAPHTRNIGACHDGTYQCVAGTPVCQGQQGPQPMEMCGNFVDDDCSGMADDGCGPP